MTTSLAESWQIFMDQYPQFMKLQRKLGGTDWYPRGGWTMFIGHYHAGIYAQWYKPHWFNYTLDGIHFETGLTAESLQSKQLQFDLHIGHRNLFDREWFNELTVPRLAEAVADWEGVKFSERNLSERLSLTVPFTKTRFADQLTAVLTQLSTLAPIIDDGLAQI